MEYEPNAQFPHHLKEPIENVGVKLNIFNDTQQPPSEKECFFLDILKEFVEASFPGVQLINVGTGVQNTNCINVAFL